MWSSAVTPAMASSRCGSLSSREGCCRNGSAGVLLASPRIPSSRPLVSSGGPVPARGARYSRAAGQVRATSSSTEAKTKTKDQRPSDGFEFVFPSLPQLPTLQNPLENLPNYENFEKASRLAQDAFNTIVVDSDDPLSGARRVAQALEAGASVLGEAIQNGESEALIKDATDAFRQAVAEIEQQQQLGGASPSSASSSALSSESGDASLRRSAKLLRKFFEKMGAAYVKLGQFIASSPTLFPKIIVDEFQGEQCPSARAPFSARSAPPRHPR